VCGREELSFERVTPTGAEYGPGPPPWESSEHQYEALGVKRMAQSPPTPSRNVWKYERAVSLRSGVAGSKV
jgi:hypothetical protein